MVYFILGLLIGGFVGFCIAIVVSVNNSDDVMPPSKNKKDEKK